MTHPIPALIAYNLSELRRHMLHMGATDEQWRDGLRLAIMLSKAQNQTQGETVNGES